MAPRTRVGLVRVALLDFFQSEGEAGAGELAGPDPLPADLVGLGDVGTDYADLHRDLGEQLLDLCRVLGEEQAAPPLHEILHGDVLVGVPLDLDLLLPGVYRET